MTSLLKKDFARADHAGAKGSIPVGLGADWDLLDRGTDGHVLTADSTQDKGIKWAAPDTIQSSEIDAGAIRPGQLGLAVINKTGSSIAANALVAVAGLDTTSGNPKIVLADADVAAHDDVWVTTAAIANNASGVVYKGALSPASLNTNSASTAGDPVYLSTTAGGFAHSAPSASNSRVQPVGFVVVKSASVGQILWVIGPVRKIGTDESQINAVVGAAAGYKIASSAAPVALDGSNPTSVAHGLTTCVAVFVQLVGSSAPAASTSVLTAVINGANIDVYAWKPTGAALTDLIASTGTETFNWFAIGT